MRISQLLIIIAIPLTVIVIVFSVIAAVKLSNRFFKNPSKKDK